MLRKYRELEKGEFIVIGVDTSWGGLDFSVAQFLSYHKLDVPLVYHKKALASEMTPVVHREAERIFDETGVPPVVAIERQNGGIAEIERLIRLNRLNKYKIYKQKQNLATKYTTGDSPKYGWDTTSASRPVMLSHLKEAVDNHLITIYDRPTINEMFSFVEVQTASAWKAQAERGSHDDLVMALAIAWQLYQSEKPPAQRNTRAKKRKQYDPTTGRVIS